LIEGRKHRRKILRAPAEIHAHPDNFPVDRDRFSNLIRLLIMEPRNGLRTLIYAQEN
jgi:hypothetical protein